MIAVTQGANHFAVLKVDCAGDCADGCLALLMVVPMNALMITLLPFLPAILLAI